MCGFAGLRAGLRRRYDIALVLDDLWLAAPSVASLFHQYGTISNLHKSAEKFVAVPLWPGNLEQIKVLNLDPDIHGTKLWKADISNSLL